jgi:hypothetical protein
MNHPRWKLNSVFNVTEAAELCQERKVEEQKFRRWEDEKRRRL